MEKIIDFTSTQWGVGQGGFHSHTIRIRDDGDTSDKKPNFEMVFDCGSSTAPMNNQDQVEQYVSELASRQQSAKVKQLDLLVVSHFDVDHLSALKKLGAELRKEKIKLKKLIAPFITPQDAVFIVISYVISFNSSNGIDMQEIEAALDTITDPIRLFSDIFDISEDDISLIGPPNFEVGPPQTPEGPDNAESTYTVVSSDPQNPSTSPTHSFFIFANSHVLWEILSFSVEPTNRAQDVLAWEKEVNSLIKAKLKKKNQIWTPITFSQISPTDLMDLIKDHHKEMSEAARKQGFNANRISICIYSGVSPDVNSSFSRSTTVRGLTNGGLLPAARVFYHHFTEGFAWFGTADTALKVQSDIDSLTRYFSDRLKNIQITAIPHHGSKNNSSPALWRELPSANIATVHFGAKSNHKHPHQEVIAEIGKTNIQPILVDTISYRINARIKVTI